MKVLTAIFVLLAVTLHAPAQTAKVVPILDLQMDCLLGGSENGKWVKPEQVVTKMKAENAFRLLALDEPPTENVSYPKPVSNRDEPICSDLFRFENPKPRPAAALGAVARWNPTPRPVQALPAANETYRQIVRDFVRTRDLTATKIGTVSFYKVDLEGDGTDEVVIAATYYKNGLSASAAANDYSFVVLRKIINGAPQNILIAGDFIKKAIEFGAPAQHGVTAIADLNGDGKMEIVIHSSYYEGGWTDVYEIKGSIRTQVLGCACGV